jgi:adenine-specific DNA-methyltransferase
MESRGFNIARDNGNLNPFDLPEQIIICSYHFASAKATEIKNVAWDLVVIDEAHRLRNIYKASSKLARRIAEALGSAHKLLLTATPLQNSLMELYGLVSVIDDHVFGDTATFRGQFTRNGDGDGRNQGLRERMKSICIRTLRKQVTEYIPFTKRVPITQDFTPSDKEHQLYELVSAYLQRDTLIALPASQRTLITLVLRKLLASSTFAIAGTLRGLIERLEELVKAQTQQPLLDEDDLEGIDELQDEIAEREDDAGDQQVEQPGLPMFNDQILKAELADLQRYAALAEDITANAKGTALLDALKSAFTKAAELGAPRKAVIFTESRRTQKYLFDLLTANGYDGQLAMLNGSNNDPTSKAIYEEWKQRNEDKEGYTGSKAVDVKAALTEHFRDKATILIATEAAAEGVNLQFCSLVVNYDLPWNPQRIEQRIGRCHRYGQKHDVVVVNFINRRNEADKRVFQLLRDKFKLFDGVFGASDEVLGALESGVDIERRIVAVYQTCRTTEEIAAAFDQLQQELDDQIQARMAETRATLLEHFDVDVGRRLRVAKDQAVESLDLRQEWLLQLARNEMGDHARFADGMPRFNYTGPDAPHGWYHLHWKEAQDNGDTFFRQEHKLAETIINRAIQRQLPPVSVTLDYARYAGNISIVEPLVGKSGILELSKLTIRSLATEDFLVFAARTDDGQMLDEEVCRKLMCLPAATAPWAVPPDCAMPDLSPIRQGEIDRNLKESEKRNEQFFDDEVQKLDHWSEDLKQSLERQIKDMDVEIRQAKAQARLAAGLNEKLEAQKKIKTLEKNRKTKRAEFYAEQDRIDTKRDDLIGNIEKQLNQQHSAAPLFTIRWTVV